MITPADTEFHPSDPNLKTWTETMVLIFSVPEAGILGNVYVLARPNVGVATSSVVIHQGFCEHPYEIDFTDPQVHMPCPESFSSFSLPSGLSVEVTKPLLDYHVTYASACGACSLDLEFHGLMPPFDMHDSAQNPLYVPGDDWAEMTNDDSHAKGHFDLLGRVTGTLNLRGKSYRVDCVEGVDHSWGPRSESSAGTGDRAVSWHHVAFGEEYGLYLAMGLDIRDGRVRYDDLRFGYVMEQGEVFGLVDAQMETERVGMLGVGNQIVATDVRGQRHELQGTAVGGAPWYSFNPCCVSFQSLYRYQRGDQVAYNEGADIFGLGFLADRLSRHGRQRSSRTPSVLSS